jgi:mannose-binding lectin
MIVYAQSSGTQNTNSSSWTPMPGLAVKVPQGVGENALLILNVPNPYATGDDTPGGSFAISVNGEIQAPWASFTYNEAVPPSTGRIPTTLCVVVPLSEAGPMLAEAMWCNVRGSNVIIDSPATLTAIID